MELLVGVPRKLLATSPAGETASVRFAPLAGSLMYRSDQIAEDTGQKGANTTIANKTVMVAGATRGIGRALVDEALPGGAKEFERRSAAFVTEKPIAV